MRLQYAIGVNRAVNPMFIIRLGTRFGTLLGTLFLQIFGTALQKYKQIIYQPKKIEKWH